MTPSADTNITIVGGTTLTTSGSGGSWTSETVWNRGNGVGSGGGISTTDTIPSWQQGLDMSANQGSTIMRNIPDVAMVADNIFVIYGNGNAGIFGGTSCSTPLWAAFTALINQQAAANAKPPVGFVNPAIYAIGSGASYTSTFHDITTGDNTSSASPTRFHAATGYDPCTGWGTPAGQPLINALVGLLTPTPPTISIQPKSVTNASGNTVNFTVSVIGSFPMSFQWSFNGTTNLIAGATNATLTMTNIQLTNAGNYAVLVTNAYGSALSSNAILTVLSLPPTITVQPGNQTVIVGGTAGFSVTAIGSLPLSYQWSLGLTNIVGATNATLVLANVQFTNAGNYTVLVTNLYGSVLSSNAVLTVNVAPPCAPVPAGMAAWWAAEGNGNDSTGTNPALLQGVAFGTGEVGQAFSFNGINAYGRVPASASLDAGQGTGLTIEAWINPASPSDLRPIFEWNNNNGQLSGTGVQLWQSVNGAGEIHANVLDTGGNNHHMGSANGVLTANSFQHIALTYDKASGVAVLYRNGVAVATQTLGSFTPQTSFDLYMGVRPSGSFAGIYFQGLLDEASVYNRALTIGEIQSIYNAAVLGKCPPLPAPPTILVQPTNQTVIVGGIATFTVSASGTQPLIYQWNFNGTNIAGATNTTLILAGVQFTNSGNYAVLVTNRYGSILSSNAVLTVNPPPPCTPPPPGLVSWWRAETNALDSFGTNNGVAQNITYTNGEVGKSFVFDGSSSYVRVPASSNLDVGKANGFTLEAWVNPASLQYGGFLPAMMFEWNSGSGSGDAPVGVQFDISGGVLGSLSANLEDTTTAFHSLSSATGIMVLNVFQHVALTYDKTTGVAVLYRNGVAVATQNLGIFTPQTSFDLYLGKRQAGTFAPFYFAGILDEASIYNRALTLAEIQSIYNAGAQGKCPAPPAVLVQPTNQTVAVGGSATFTVVANGNQPLTYQWNLNGTNIIGATSPVLLLNNLQLTNAGNYTVLVTNAYGSVLSSNATLTVFTIPPFITAQPTNQTVLLGNLATFSVAAGGTAPLSYQWALGLTNIVGATNSGLLLSNVQLTNAGNYTVLVTNASGSILSSNAVLTVNLPPPCTAPPAGLVSWWRGETNALDSQGTNDGTLQGGMSFGPGEVGQGLVFNGTSGRVKIPASASLNAGLTNGFTFEFWFSPANTNNLMALLEWNNGSGSTAGIGVQLWLYGQGRFYANIIDTSLVAHDLITPPGTQVANSLQHVAFTYNKSTGVATYYWNGVLVTNSTIGSFTPLATFDLYLGSRIAGPAAPAYFQGTMDEVSIYRRALSASEVQAIYAAGISGKCLTGPSVVSQPTNQTVAVGGTATFTVAAQGPRPYLYQWSFNGTNIGGATNITLTLTNVQISQIGNYAVAITNAYGSTLSSNGLLTVFTVPAFIVTQPTNQSVVVGSTATFTVSAGGTAPLTYQWAFGSTNIAGATNAVLTLTNVQLTQAGNYTVLVTNNSGSILSSNALLVVSAHHFSWNLVPSPRFLGTPFPVVIQAQNAANGLLTNYTSPVYLTSTNGLPITPSISGNFVQGVWTGSVTVLQLGSNVVLRADDGLGHFGLANPISVVNLPSLGLMRFGNVLLMQWSAISPAFVLESSGSLVPGSWVAVPYVPAQIGGQYAVPLEMIGTNGFYRLRFIGP